MGSFKRYYINYLIMFFLMGISGNPYFSSSKVFGIVFAGCLLLIFLNRKRQSIDGELLYVLLAILICVLFQSLIFSFFKTITILGVLLRVLIAYLSVKLLGKFFVDYFLQLMVFFSILSIIIFIPVFIKPDILNTLNNAVPSFLSYQYEFAGDIYESKSLIIYNLMQEVGQVRNPGPFWEPGAFGGYLIIALMFNTIKNGKILTKINVLFIIAILSTQSTTAYIALFIFIFFYIFFGNYSILVKFLIIAFGFAGYIAFQNIPFLGEKIKEQNATKQEAIETSGGDTRIASAVLDWEDIKRYPLSGRGLWPETRVDKKFEYVIRNNGFTNFIATWGILFFFYYFYLYYKGFYHFCRINEGFGFKYLAFLVLIVFWVISLSENYFDSPFFWAFIFIHIPLKNL